MRIDTLTLFPEMFAGVLGSSILKRAAESVRDPSTGVLRPPLVSYHLHNLRTYTADKHGKVDQPPFGGGPGMVIQCQPVWDAVQAIEAQDPAPPTRILLTPQGQPLTQAIVEQLALKPRLLLIAGHYEAIDERVIDRLKTTPPQGVGASDPMSSEIPGSHLLELSLGDYVLSGGELPAMVLIDAVVRLLPGALGHEDSAHHDSFSPGADRLLDHPHYTRPRVWAGMEAPDVLLSGDHARIAAWRRAQALERTRARRPDLLQGSGTSVPVCSVRPPQPFTIRPETPADHGAIDALLTAAFPTDAEARLVRALRASGDAAISLIAVPNAGPSTAAPPGAAVEGPGALAHLLFSPLHLADQPSLTGYLALGPLAVHPDHQHRGIGSALVRAGLDVCRQAAARAVFVLGDPAYYARFGFEPASPHGFTPADYPDAGDAFQILILRPPLPPTARGPLRYAPAFRDLPH